VTAAEVSPWQLAWVPLMHGGTEAGIIVRWRDVATRLMADESDRADLGSLALTFAILAGCRPVWEKALRGWNMQTSPFLDEIRAQGREEGREEGRAEGERSMLLHLGRQKFGKTPSKKQQKVLDAIDDLTQLKALAERLLVVDSWADLLAEG
jgi:predicted transposase YdaD